MSTEDQTAVASHPAPPPPPPPTWGAPEAAAGRGRPWSTKRVIIVAAIALVVVGGGSAAIIAVTSGHASTAAANARPGMFGRGGMGRFGRGGAGALPHALHGDFVATGNDGGYVTERLQTGKVTAVSSGSITVASADGYSSTYVVNSGTAVDRGADNISAVANGDTVTVIGTVSGNTATATNVLDQAHEPADQPGGGI